MSDSRHIIEVVSRPTMARLLNLSERRIGELIGAGMPYKPSPPGLPVRFDAVETTKWYMRRVAESDGRDKQWEEPDMSRAYDAAARGDVELAMSEMLETLPTSELLINHARHELTGATDVDGSHAVEIESGPLLFCGMSRTFADAVAAVVNNGRARLRIVALEDYDDRRPSAPACRSFPGSSGEFLPAALVAEQSGAFSAKVRSVESDVRLIDPFRKERQTRAIAALSDRAGLGILHADEWAAWTERLSAAIAGLAAPPQGGKSPKPKHTGRRKPKKR